MNYNKPFYSLRLTTDNAGYMIAINGCIIESHNSIAPNKMEYPINHWLKNGKNSFDIYHLNVPNGFEYLGLRADGQITLELCVRESDSQNTTIIQRTIYQGNKLNISEGETDYSDIEALLATLESSSKPSQFNIIEGQLTPDENGAFIIGDYQVEDGITEALHISQNITLPTPFPLWRFFEADELTYHLDLTDEEWESTRKHMLEEVYQPIWQALNDNDSQALTEIFKGRGEEFDQAFYKPNKGQDAFEMAHHLKGLINDKNISSVRPLKLNESDVHVSFNKKLTWLHVFDYPLISIVDFKHNDADIVTRIPVMFARFDGKWEIVR